MKWIFAVFFCGCCSVMADEASLQLYSGTGSGSGSGAGTLVISISGGGSSDLLTANAVLTGTSLVPLGTATVLTNNTGGTLVLSANGTTLSGTSNGSVTGNLTLLGGNFLVSGNPIALVGSATGGNLTVSNNSNGPLILLPPTRSLTWSVSANQTSGFGSSVAYGNTLANVLALDATQARTIYFHFNGTSSAGNDAVRKSEVLDFSGTQDDVYVLSLHLSALSADSFLGWKNPVTNLWVNAIDGNTGNNATAAQQGYGGSFQGFQAAYGTGLANYLGAYGVDLAGGNVWAVINHNSEFSVIPEPSPVSLLLGGPLLVVSLAGLRRFTSKKRAA